MLTIPFFILKPITKIEKLSIHPRHLLTTVYMYVIVDRSSVSFRVCVCIRAWKPHYTFACCSFYLPFSHFISFCFHVHFSLARQHVADTYTCLLIHVRSPVCVSVVSHRCRFISVWYWWWCWLATMKTAATLCHRTKEECRLLYRVLRAKNMNL